MDLELPHIRGLPAVLPGLFADAAGRAQAAGFDGVELHYAHAYTLASFLSRTNTRTDGYAAAHGLSGDAASSPRNLLRIILTDRWDDVRVTVKPHLRDHGDALASGLAAWLVRIDDEFKRIMRATAGLDNARREFALAVQAAKLPIAPMISIWTAKVDTARGWVDQQRRADGEWGDAFLDNLAAWVGKP